VDLQDIIKDIEVASTDILKGLEQPDSRPGLKYSTYYAGDTQLVTHIDLFKKKANSLVRRELARSSSKTIKEEPKEEHTSSLGPKPTATARISTRPGDNKAVLTLVGQIRDSPQLFSSLQDTTKIPTPFGEEVVSRPLRDIALPNGIVFTDIIPADATDIHLSKKRDARVQTLGELFAGSSLLPYQPPKYRSSPIKSLTAGWVQPAVSENARLRNSQSYFSAPLKAGEWLDYTGSIPEKDSRRKTRARTLSLGGIKNSLTEIEAAEFEGKKADELFKSAYSSFAPTHDNSAAVIPEHVVNRIWWQRNGEKSYERLVSNKRSVDAFLANSMANEQKLSPSGNDGLDDAIIADAVENWEEVIDPSLLEPATAPEEEPFMDKDVQSALDDIAGLLETFNSHQRNRNLAPPAIPRAGGSLTSAEDPTKPSEEEQRTYDMLKSMLVVMIQSLPPYAVAKLNGDQLAELSISTSLPVFTETYKGVLQEEEAARLARTAAQSSARTSTANSQRGGASALYGNQYPASAARPPSGTSQYYAGTSTPNRAPPNNANRPPATVGPAPYASSRPPASANYRAPPPAPYAQPAYPHQAPRANGPPNYPTAPGPGPAAYYGTPTANKFGPAPNYPPQTAPQPGRYTNPMPQYPPRSAAPPGHYPQYPPANPAVQRQPSPAKPAPSQPFTQQYPISTPARGYGMPTPSPAPQTYYTNMNGTPGTATNSTPGGAAVPMGTPGMPNMGGMPVGGSLGATGYHTVMTPAEQSTMMERQRAQLAQQQGLNSSARPVPGGGVRTGSPFTSTPTPPLSGMMGTPQPPHAPTPPRPV
jgi:hypothetical protein